MLSIEDVVQLYQEDVNVRLRRKIPSDFESLSDEDSELYKGAFDPETNDINIYSCNVHSREEFDLVLLHEFIHARDYLLGSANKCMKDDTDEDAVDQETKQTYKKRPKVVEFIKQVFDVKNYSCPRRR